jgi:hypothetical protein
VRYCEVSPIFRNVVIEILFPKHWKLNGKPSACPRQCVSACVIACVIASVPASFEANTKQLNECLKTFFVCAIFRQFFNERWRKESAAFHFYFDKNYFVKKVQMWTSPTT